MELSARGPFRYLEPYFGALIAQLECTHSPHLNPMLELFEPNVVDGELVPPKAWEAIQHLGEYDRAEATVLLACQFEETHKAKTRLDGHQIDVVAGLRPPEHGKHLVGGEFFG